MNNSRQKSGGCGLMKLICICCSLLILVFFMLRPSGSSAVAQLKGAQGQHKQAHERTDYRTGDQAGTKCSRMPPSLSHTLIHYATTNITPQQSKSEISVTDHVLRRKSPCNFLVFGLGYDSLMWATLNHGGRTLFLEEDSTWIQQIQSQFPELTSLHVTYNTKVRHAEELLRSAAGGSTTAACSAVVDPRESECPLSLKGLPREVYEVEWDVIMVDAPTGFHDEAPGRMGAIYTAGLLARGAKGPTDVMVHDVDRTVEDQFSMAFLCKGYFKEQRGRLRHFVLPARPAAAAPFCPTSKS